jgi:hypothetical protein
MNWIDTLRKDFYYGKNDPDGVETAYRTLTAGQPQYGDDYWRAHSVRSQLQRNQQQNPREVSDESLSMGVQHTQQPWFGTNLSDLGRAGKVYGEINPETGEYQSHKTGKGKEILPEESDWEDWVINQIADTETHEATHLAQKPMLRDAANEVREQRIKEAEEKGVRVLGDTDLDREWADEVLAPQSMRGGGKSYYDKTGRATEPTFMDKLRRRKIADESEFNISPEEMTEWEEGGAFASTRAGDVKNKDGIRYRRASSLGRKSDLLSDSDWVEDRKQGYQGIQDKRKKFDEGIRSGYDHRTKKNKNTRRARFGD